MAELTIRLVVDPATGKKDVHIGYRSDADALPMEHEEAHGRWWINCSPRCAQAEELGRVIVGEANEAPATTEVAQPQRTPQKGVRVFDVARQGDLPKSVGLANFGRQGG